MNIQGFVGTLPIMAYGMLGIFAVIGIIVLVIKLMNWAFAEKKD